MKSWYFSEQSYHPAWDLPGSIKINAPSAPIDPKTAHLLLKSYIAECVLADELGLNIMVNEHHASYTCMSVSCMLTLGILANATKKARLLALGIPILSRMDPFRIAEEIAYVDVLSQGRLEVGLIKGTPYELYVSNSHPVTANKRFWEMHQCVIAALTSRDGSFSWESENVNYRNVTVIPPCYQQPTPPMWLTTLSSTTAREAAKRGIVLGITGVALAARESFPLYREEYLNTFGKPASLDRFAYLGQVCVARDEKTAIERGRKLLRFMETSERVENRFLNPPGLLPVEGSAKNLRTRTAVTHRSKTLPDGTPMSVPPTPEEQIMNGTMFAGTPDQVYEQIKRFYDSVGGFGQFLVQMGGTNTHEEICDSLRLYATEVQPRLDELTRRGSRSYA